MFFCSVNEPNFNIVRENTMITISSVRQRVMINCCTYYFPLFLSDYKRNHTAVNFSGVCDLIYMQKESRLNPLSSLQG